MNWFLHGNLGTPKDWNQTLSDPALAPYPSEALSLSGIFGENPPPLPEAGRRIGQLITEKDNTPVLCGYSLGGRLALHAYLSRPEAWQALILIGAHTGLANDNERHDRRQTDEHWAALLETTPWEHFYGEWTSQPVFLGGKNIPRTPPSETERAFLANTFRRWSLGAQENLLPRLKDTLRRHPVPILLISGGKDAKFTRLYTELHAALPGSLLEIIPGAGHRIPEDSPSALASTIASFLRLSR